MKTELGLDCHRCPAYDRYIDQLIDAEDKCKVRASEYEDDFKITEAQFVCSAIDRTRCNVRIELPLLEVFLDETAGK